MKLFLVSAIPVEVYYLIINNTLDGILKMSPTIEAEWKIRISSWLRVTHGKRYDPVFRLQMETADAMIRLENDIRKLSSEAKCLRAQLRPLKKAGCNEQVRQNENEATKKEIATAQLSYVRKCILMIGDTIAVKLLEVDTAKYFAGFQSPGFLSGKEGFEKEIEAAHHFLNQGYMVILNDLTNCLRVGDLTLKRGEEVRTFEVKSNPQAYLTKEAFRQILTPIVLHDLIKTDVAKIPV